MAKIEPATRQLYYLIPDGTSYIDLAKDLSKVNRRLYRQGMSYVVQDIQIGMPPGMKATDVYQISFSTAGNSWVVHNAWRKGFETWRTMQNEFLDGEGARLKGKWADFKVYLDDSMASGTILDVYASDGATYSAGEWQYSNFVYDDAGTARSPSIHLIGSVTADTAVGLIQAYGDSRNYPTNNPRHPSALNTGFYSEFHGVGDIDDELGMDIEDDNDTPPYDQDEYPGGASNADAAVPMRIGSVNATQSTATVPGFVAECGLIKVDSNELQLSLVGDPAAIATSSTYEVVTAPTVAAIVTVAPGPYRGVLAAPMGQ